MLKGIIFDFDGVIVESVDIKTDAFREMFKRDYPQFLDDILAYHVHNGGISRQKKIQHFFKNIIKEPLTEGRFQMLCEQFSQLVVDKVVAAPYVYGAQELLDYCRSRFQLFIVSGTPQDEMREIIKRRNLKGYFKEVYGSPTSKSELTQTILKDTNLAPEEMIFVGDAINDYQAAQENQIAFVVRVHNEAQDWAKDKTISRSVSTMAEFHEYLKHLGASERS